MGGRCSSVTAASKQAKLRSEEIDRQLSQSAVIENSISKILLLGTKESGKSTLVKQMKVIYNDGFTEEELLSFRPTLLDNLLSSMKFTLAGMGHLRIRLEHPSNKQAAKIVLSHPTISPPPADDDDDGDDVGEHDHDDHRNRHRHGKNEERNDHDHGVANSASRVTLANDAVRALEALWRDRAVRAAVARGHEFSLNDSALYLFENMSRLTAPRYRPTVGDVLRARVRTNGVIETNFVACQGALHARLLDAGISLTSASPSWTVARWMRCFEDVRAVTFVVALSGYDMFRLDEPNVNQLQDSIELFRQVASNCYFQNCIMILLLNKMDLFRQKILGSRRHLRYYFSDFKGPDECVDSAALFIRSKLLAVTQRPVFPQFICAVDTANVKAVFEGILGAIAKSNLNSYQLL